MYLADFATTPEGDHFYITADLRSAKTCIEHGTNEALERFIRNALSLGDDRTIPASMKDASA